jgi:hypothetical protein
VVLGVAKFKNDRFIQNRVANILRKLVNSLRSTIKTDGTLWARASQNLKIFQVYSIIGKVSKPSQLLLFANYI